MTKAGGPTKYKTEYCDQVIELMYKGHSIEEVAYFLKVDKKTIYNWKDAHEEFFHALKKGADFSEGWWKLKGTQNIENKDFNSTLWYMNMKNRFGWKDKIENTHDVTVNEHIEKAKKSSDVKQKKY